MILTLYHTWDSNLHNKMQSPWGEWPPLVVTYWMVYWRDDLLTPCAGTQRSITFTIYESGN